MENNIGGLIAIGIFAICFAVVYVVRLKIEIHRLRDKLAYNDDTIRALRNDCDHWRDMYVKHSGNDLVANEKVALYKQLLDKFMPDPDKKTTDTVFMFEGQCYRPTEFSLHRCDCTQDELAVDFVKISDL